MLFVACHYYVIERKKQTTKYSNDCFYLLLFLFLKLYTYIYLSFQLFGFIYISLFIIIPFLLFRFFRFFFSSQWTHGFCWFAVMDVHIMEMFHIIFDRFFFSFFFILFIRLLCVSNQHIKYLNMPKTDKCV